MIAPIKIGIAEDHPLLRNALIDLLNEEPGFEIVLKASNGSELMSALQVNKPEILLLDIAMPILNGLQALTLISQQYPELKVIIFSTHFEDKIVCKSFNCGARGFVSKNADFTEIVDAIYQVEEFGYFPNEFLSKKIIDNLKKNIDYSNHDLKTQITNREKEILKLICEGFSNNEISQKLFISIRTVENHRKSIFVKTKTKGLADLVVYAVRQGLFIIEDKSQSSNPHNFLPISMACASLTGLIP